jgi:hypothetical protein
MAAPMTIGASTLSPAAQAIGLGDQVGGESDEQRKRRLQSIAASQQRNTPAAGYAAALSPAGVAVGLG